MVDAITTVWDWINEVNAEGGTGFAGHADWRLPSESGCNTCYTNGAGGLYQCTACDDHELETILLSPYPCETSPCIASIFGSTASGFYWSASANATTPPVAWGVHFAHGGVYSFDKPRHYSVRAVRGGS